jgi:hypothetical protein
MLKLLTGAPILLALLAMVAAGSGIGLAHIEYVVRRRRLERANDAAEKRIWNLKGELRKLSR